jgi:hypothetical protein
MSIRTVSGKTFLTVLLILVSLTHAHAENIRGTLAGTVSGGGDPVTFKPEELVVLDGRDITSIQEGIEIRVDIPAGIRRFQNSFALFVYRNVQPSPSPDGAAYSGTRAYMRLLPSREALFVRIPLYQDHGISSDALTDVLPNPIPPGDFPLIVTVLPVMKGVPDSAFDQQLRISASEIWKNEGTLTVEVANPSGDPGEIIEMTVDGRTAEVGSSVTLEAGLHRIVVSSTHAPTVEKTVAIEPGRAERIEISLDYTPPEISLAIPEGAEVYLDGNRVESRSSMAVLSSQPGEHTVRYVLGGLEVSRSFSIRPGGKVRIDLLFEIDIVDYGDDSGNRYGAGDG